MQIPRLRATRYARNDPRPIALTSLTPAPRARDTASCADPRVHDEPVPPRALADHAIGTHRDRLIEAILERFHLDELTAEIIAGDLGHRRRGVGRHALPARHAHIAAALHRVIAEVRAP